MMKTYIVIIDSYKRKLYHSVSNVNALRTITTFLHMDSVFIFLKMKIAHPAA